jgi:hypothetical protein
LPKRPEPSSEYKKCEFMIFSLAPQGPRTGLQLTLNDEVMVQVKSYRYLGVEFDEKLTFSNHSRNIVAKTKRGIGAICSWIRKWASKAVLAEAISKIVLPSLLYAIEAWYPANLHCRRSIEGIQKYAARLVLNDFLPSSNYEALLKRLEWKPIYRTVAEKRLMFIKRYMDGEKRLPPDIFPMEETNIHRASGRLAQKKQTHSLRLKIFETQKNSREDSLAGAQMRMLWNALDEETVRAKKFLFKETTKSEEMFKIFCDRNIIDVLTDV